MLAALVASWSVFPACADSAGAAAQGWVATWGQAMTSQYVQVAGHDGKPERDAYGQPLDRAPTVEHLTLRQSVNVSAGGKRVRIRLSNYYGRAPLTVSS
ncbi:MAG TPA: GDSL family lipase, partial [Rhodanobacter sp.]|nr:GDSL family lipase [Rhodanobacter sp.]